MKTSRISLIALFFVLGLTAVGQDRPQPAAVKNPETPEEPAASYLTRGSFTVCKGHVIPDGYMISGETVLKQCPNHAWIIRSRGQRPPSLIDQLSMLSASRRK